MSDIASALSALSAGGKKFTQAIDNLAASLFPPQYAFAGVGDSQSLFRAMSRNADEAVELTNVQKNFRAVMAEASEVAGTNSKKINIPLKTAKEADLAADALGYKKTNYLSHNKPVYKKGGKYITPDIDSHNGGIWKMADSVNNLRSKRTRLGTYDGNLQRIGD